MQIKTKYAAPTADPYIHRAAWTLTVLNGTYRSELCETS